MTKKLVSKKCGSRYEVYKITKNGSKFDQCMGNGRTWRQSWNYNKRAGQFMRGRYIVVDKKNKDHYVTN